MLGLNRLQRVVCLSLVSVVSIGFGVWFLRPFSAPVAVDWTRGYVATAKRDAVVRAFKHAWKGYERDAFGCDDYHPVSRTGSNLTTDRGIGYMIVDALDTMLIMGPELESEYRRARRWIATELDFDRDGRYSTFEITIRVLGGLLSAYALSNDDLYLRRAVELGDRLLPAFNTPHGLPIPNVNFHTEPSPDASAEPISTAEATTLQLEFRYLSHATGRDVYWRTAEKVMQVVKDSLTSEYVVDGSLVPIHMSAQTGKFIASDIRLGSRGDSYYEKQYLQTNRTEKVYRTMYDSAMTALHKHLVFQTPHNRLTYIAELEWTHSVRSKDKWRISPKQDHLVCFLGGSLLLGVSEGERRSLNSMRPSSRDARDWRVGRELTRSCMDTHRTKTGLAPEIAVFSASKDGRTGSKDWYIKNRFDSRYILRPETVESLFLGWRMTGDVQYREWGWEIFKAIEKHCKVPGGGYSGVESVDEVPVELTNNMETFFLAETLKYLYLLFDDSGKVPLDKYVFNTEAHPLPVFTPNIATKLV